jgi:hypothetical protein
MRKGYLDGCPRLSIMYDVLFSNVTYVYIIIFYLDYVWLTNMFGFGG